jgi:hypothetical protein
MVNYDYLLNLSHVDPLIDDNCQWLVDYLGTGLNWAIGQHFPNEIAVRSTRSYDAIAVDLSSYPVLKVFRQQQTSDRALVYNTTVVVSYAMTLPKQDDLPGIMQWVATHITAMLTYLGETDRGCPFLVDIYKPFKHEFRIMVNDLSQPTYCYLRVSFEAIETRGSRFV